MSYNTNATHHKHKTPYAGNKPVVTTLTAEQINKSVSVLNRSFRESIEAFKTRIGKSSNVVGTDLYFYQTEFAYVIDKIQRGPIFLAIQHIAEANELIKKVDSHQKS